MLTIQVLRNIFFEQTKMDILKPHK